MNIWRDSRWKKFAPLWAGLIVGLTLALPTTAQANLLTNGDFELGNTGFFTQYTLNNATGVPEGVYSILQNPSTWHPNAASYGDHTTGNGLMMAINGAIQPNVIVWSQTVSVSPNTFYTFSGWVSSWVSLSPAVLDIQINGNSIGQVTAPSTTATWQQFSFTWNSGSSTSAQLSIVNLNTVAIGNDFALDDLEFVPEPTSIAFLGMGVASLLFRKNRKR